MNFFLIENEFLFLSEQESKNFMFSCNFIDYFKVFES